MVYVFIRWNHFIIRSNDFLKKTSKQHIKQSSLAGLTVGFFLCVGYVLQTFGLLYTTSSKAGFLTGLSIVMVPILSFIF